jgi:hypothetical protein
VYETDDSEYIESSDDEGSVFVDEEFDLNLPLATFGYDRPYKRTTQLYSWINTNLPTHVATNLSRSYHAYIKRGVLPLAALSPPSTPTERPDTFVGFANLPTEVREMIWLFAFAETKTDLCVGLCEDINSDGSSQASIHRLSLLPTLMRVSREAYDVGDRLVYAKPFGTRHLDTYHFRPETDTLFVRQGPTHLLADFMGNGLGMLKHLQLPLACWTDHREGSQEKILNMLVQFKHLSRLELVAGDGKHDAFFREWDLGLPALKMELAEAYLQKYDRTTEYTFPAITMKIVPALLAKYWRIDNLADVWEANFSRH